MSKLMKDIEPNDSKKSKKILQAFFDRQYYLWINHHFTKLVSEKNGTFAGTYAMIEEPPFFVQKASMFLSAGREIILSMQLVDKERCLPSCSSHLWKFDKIMSRSVHLDFGPSSQSHFGGCKMM